MYFRKYLADTDIADIQAGDIDKAETDIQFADTDVSVSAKYIS